MSNTSIRYDAVIDICDRLDSVIRDINTQVEKINSFANNKSDFWEGTAANKFYDEVSKKYRKVSELTENSFSQYFQSVKEIVEKNKMTDTEINAEQIKNLEIPVPSISASGATPSIIKKLKNVNTDATKTTTTTKNSKTATGTIDLGINYPISDKTKPTQKSDTKEVVKSLDKLKINSDVNQTGKLDDVSHSSNSTSGAISLSDLLKFMK